MLTKAELDLYRTQLDTVVGSASTELARFWDDLDLEDPEAARDELLRFIPGLVNRYGDLAAALGADFYDDLRASANVKRSYSATMAAGTPEETILDRVRFGVQHLWTGNPEQSLAFLGGAATGYILQTNRDTIRLSAQRDPAQTKWNRVPEANACAYCLEASLAVYNDEEAAGNEYHDGCQCTAVPAWDDSPIPDFDPEAIAENLDSLEDA